MLWATHQKQSNAKEAGAGSRPVNQLQLPPGVATVVVVAIGRRGPRHRPHGHEVGDCYHADGADEPKSPLPAETLREEPANNGAQAIPKCNSNTDNAKVIAALLERGDVGNGDLDQGIDGPRAQARQGARREELITMPRQSGQQIPQGHDGQGGRQRRPAAEDVRQPPVDELDARAGDEEAGRHEAGRGTRVEGGRDGGQTRRDGCLVEERQELNECQGGHDDEQAGAC